MSNDKLFSEEIDSLSECLDNLYDENISRSQWVCRDALALLCMDFMMDYIKAYPLSAASQKIKEKLSQEFKL